MLPAKSRAFGKGGGNCGLVTVVTTAYLLGPTERIRAFPQLNEAPGILAETGQPKTKLIGLQLCHLKTYKTATSTVGGFGRLSVMLLNHVTFVFLCYLLKEAFFFSFITLQKSPKSKGLGVLTPGAETVCHFPSTAACD